MNHTLYMQRALDLATMAYPACRPNPLVGAVLVVNGRVVGEGYTQAYGGAHAEVMAIAGVADDLLRQATLYVTLEPCAHFGKTPPCANLILEKGIPEVYIACHDPFKEVDGKGIERLQSAGVRVHVGLLEAEARWQNRRFFTQHEQSRPYIVLKWAETADGFIDDDSNAPLRISSQQSSQLVHRWRAREQAILVGGETARRDNPSLTTRLVSGPNPERYVWTHKELSADLKLSSIGCKALVANGIENLIKLLLQHGVQSVLVEGGRRVLQQFIDAGLYDEVKRIVGLIEIGQGVPGPQFVAKAERVEYIGNDRIEYFSREES